MSVRFCEAKTIGVVEPAKLLELETRFPNTELVTDVLFDDQGELDIDTPQPELCRAVASLVIAHSEVAIYFSDINFVRFSSNPVLPGRSQHAPTGEDRFALWHTDTGRHITVCSCLPFEVLMGVRKSRAFGQQKTARKDVEDRLNKDDAAPESLDLTVKSTKAGDLTELNPSVTHRAKQNPNRAPLKRVYVAIGLHSG